MASIWTMGEILVEIMRPRAGMKLGNVAEFLGPYPSGAPAIFIDTVALLGHSAGIIGGVGADDFGRCVLDRMQADGVNCDHVIESQTGATAVAFVSYSADGSRTFIYHIDGTPAVAAPAWTANALGSPDCFHVMGCSLMTNDDFRELIVSTAASCHAEGATISFDPNIRAELLGNRSLQDVVGPVMQMCSVLLPGVSELAMLGGKQTTQENVDQLFGSTPIQVIVVKLGSRGCTVYTHDEPIDVPAYPVEEVDPTGAGDCFDAGFLCGLLEGRPLAECARIAAASGALNAAAFGPMEGNILPATVNAMLNGM